MEKPETEQAVELPLEAAASSSSEASTDESSSASDESADAQDLCGVLADSSAPEDLSWLRQGKKVHLIREEVEGRAVFRGAVTLPSGRTQLSVDGASR